MNREEKIVLDFLVNHNLGEVVFEPRGFKKIPDFSLNESIGIEVRRLNRQVPIEDNYEPIENTRYSFLRMFDKLLSELERPDLDYSIGVEILYKRPIELNNGLKRKIKESIIESTLNEDFGSQIKLSDEITYSLIKGKGKSTSTYFRCLTHDLDQGGIVQDMRYEALLIAIQEKEFKIRDIKSDYEEIWLILVDDIFSRVDYTIKQDLQRYEEIKSSFSRIILISGRDKKSWIDIYPWNEYKKN